MTDNEKIPMTTLNYLLIGAPRASKFWSFCNHPPINAYPPLRFGPNWENKIFCIGGSNFAHIFCKEGSYLAIFDKILAISDQILTFFV